jgi:hypothetical protein
MKFRKINNITGWIVFFIAFATYFLTREARGSLWDCGEFVACAYKMQMPHPPGAPLFVLLGRFFIILFGNDPMHAANAVNIMSALASAATILFLFWTVTHFARKMFVKVGEELTGQQIFTVMSAGIVGGLAYTFSDSFWFSAVEGEVYALSSFFTALVFWAMLKWEHADEHAGTDTAARTRADRWIVFLFFMMGLSIGVHLLNLLTIPAIVMIYYYRRYKISTRGAIIAFLIGCAITGLVQAGVIQYSMKAAGQFDVFFVNTLGMPFFSGFAVYFILIAGLIIWALFFKENTSKTKLTVWFVLLLALSLLPFIVSLGSGALKVFKFLLVGGAGFAIAWFLKPGGLRILKLALWCYAFMLVGYFMYFTSLIRSNANPAIDMNNVDNPINLVYYLAREQYGSAPLLYGPHFLAEVKYDPVTRSPYKFKEMKYVKDRNHNKYIPIGKEREVNYEDRDKQLFPRIWSSSNDQFHFDTYVEWLNLRSVDAFEFSVVTRVTEGLVQTQNQAGKSQNYSIEDNYRIQVREGQYLRPGEAIAIKTPTYGDNLNWFFSYQLGFMYWRYFMWNFSGKQNDIQGYGNKRDGNWISGIPIIDNKRLGDQDQLPESLKNNKARNTLFMLPFILGIIGCVYHFFKNKNDWIVTFLLFFFTGIAVVLYLNQPGNQPRERDYAYVGSFYAFAIWIGLAVVSLVRLARETMDKKTFGNTIMYGSLTTFLVTLLSTPPAAFGDMLMTAIFATVYFAMVAALLIYVLRAVSSAGKNLQTLNIATFILCLAVPLLMAQQEWDDHDRSKKTLAPDLAKNYLESCAPNAIIFTFGDNDTYPLWYAQEVEGVRPDIRIINNSLLGIDWYINQLRYKVNNADSVDVIWTPEQVEGRNREYMYYRPVQGVSQETYFPLYDAMKNVLGKYTPDPETKRDVGPQTFPVKKFSIPVDTNLVRQNGTVNPDDIVLNELRIELNKNGLQRNDMIILNIIAANNWKRPIYFTSPSADLGFNQFMRKDGLSYRLVPVESKYTQGNWEVEKAMRENRLGGSSIRDNNMAVIFNNLYEHYAFGNADKPGVYFDEENRRHLLGIRTLFGEAAGNLADAGKTEEANKLLDKSQHGINTDNFPYAMVSRYNNHNQAALVYLEAFYKTGRKEEAEKIRLAIRKDLEQQKNYYEYIRTSKPDVFSGWYERTEYPINEAALKVLEAIEVKYAPETIKQPEKQQDNNPANNLLPGNDGTKNPDSPK